MTKQEEIQVQKSFIALAEVYGSKPYSDMALKFISQQLTGNEFHKVMDAINKYVKTTKYARPPNVSDILEIINPQVSEKEEANLLAAKVVSCISRHGYTWSHGFYMGGVMRWAGKEGKLYDNFSDAIKSELGEVGEYVVKVFGGFTAVCERCGDKPGILQAQIREVTATVLIKSKNGTLEESLKLPESHSSLEIAAQVKALSASAIK